jgi:hypothetical protein
MMEGTRIWIENEEDWVSRRQYAFLMGVVLVWIAWAAGWVVFAAIAAGLVGYAVVRLLEGDPGLGELSERFRSEPK